MEKFLKIINFFIILLIFVSIPTTIRNILTPKEQIKRKSIEISSKKIQKKIYRLSDFKFILKKNPFGIKLKENSSDSEKVFMKKIFDFYILIGTVYDHSGKGYAIFMDKEGNQSIYSTGKRLSSFGKLVSVRQNKVIFEETELKLIDIKDAMRMHKAPNRNIMKIISNKREENFIKKLNNGEYLIDRQKVEEAIEHPQHLMMDARLQPVFRDGKQYGFLLKEVRRNGIYYKLGLRNNDLLLRINEFDITNPESALRAFNELKGADNIELYILRNGKQKVLRYIIK